MKAHLSQTTVDLSQPFVPLLETLGRQGGETERLIRMYLPKARAVLRDYAAFTKKASLDKLTLLDVVSDTSQKVEINADLVKYIDEVSHRQGKDQIRSQIRGLLQAVFGPDGEEGVAVGVGFVKSMLPDWMHALWEHLPKNGEGGLSPKSRHLLGVLLYVVTSQGVTAVATLMVEMADHVSEAIRDAYQSSVWKNLDTRVSQLRKRLGLAKPRGGRENSLPLDAWPPTLRSEWVAFDAMASAGPSERQLEAANSRRITLKKLEESSRTTYFEKIAKFLHAVAPQGDLALKDLLLIKKITVEEDGAGKRKSGIEDYRRREQGRRKPGKAPGKDSQDFVGLLSALKTMAAYHGLFVLREKFSAVYKATADQSARREKREEKKAAYSQEFIDGEIDKLYKEYVEIVRGRSFKTDRRSMHLCVFFVAFLTMRYLGLRQQAIRNCEEGTNIIFGPGGRTITFYWPKALVKTKRPISITLDKGVDRTHALLIDALWKFRQHVYPHILQNQGQPLGGQFFVNTDQSGRFIRFKRHTNFYQWFSNASLQFLPLKGKLKGRKEGLHPHFLRGFAVDWLLDYGLSVAEVADLMNISEKTVRGSYAGQESPVRTRSALNALQMKRLEKEILKGGGVRVELVAEHVAAKVMGAIKKSSRAERRGRSAADREYIAKLEAVIAALKKEVAGLRQQTAGAQLSLNF